MTSSQHNSKGERISLPSFEEMMNCAAVDESEVYPEADGGDEALMRRRVAEDMEKQSKARARREIQETEAKCEALRKEAEAEAVRIKQEAENEAAELRARVEEDTVSQLESRYNEEVGVLRRTMQAAAEGYKKEQEALFAALQPKLTELCFQIVGSIVHYELDKGDEAYKSIIENAVETLKSESNMVLHMPPVSYERIFGGKNNEYLAQLNEREIKVVKDKDVLEGDCLLTGDRGGVRAGAQTQSARLREAVLQKWGEDKK